MNSSGNCVCRFDTPHPSLACPRLFFDATTVIGAQFMPFEVALLVARGAATLDGVDDHPRGLLGRLRVGGEGELAAAAAVDGLTGEGGGLRLADGVDGAFAVDDVGGARGHFAGEVVAGGGDGVGGAVGDEFEGFRVLEDDVAGCEREEEGGEEERRHG
ncbi:endoglucanase [Colletotrichum asianum]